MKIRWRGQREGEQSRARKYTGKEGRGGCRDVGIWKLRCKDAAAGDVYCYTQKSDGLSVLGKAELQYVPNLQLKKMS